MNKTNVILVIVALFSIMPGGLSAWHHDGLGWGLGIPVGIGVGYGIAHHRRHHYNDVNEAKDAEIANLKAQKAALKAKNAQLKAKIHVENQMTMPENIKYEDIK